MALSLALKAAALAAATLVALAACGGGDEPETAGTTAATAAETTTAPDGDGTDGDDEGEGEDTDGGDGGDGPQPGVVVQPTTIPEDLPNGRGENVDVRAVAAPAPGRSATRLEADARCKESDPSQQTTTLSWKPADERGRAQRVALTTLIDGFQTKQFDLGRPLAPGRTKVAWERLHGQAAHFWVVLTLHGDRWVSSEPARFEGATCVADLAPTTS